MSDRPTLDPFLEVLPGLFLPRSSVRGVQKITHQDYVTDPQTGKQPPAKPAIHVNMPDNEWRVHAFATEEERDKHLFHLIERLNNIGT